jgi:hypothetical protein
MSDAIPEFRHSDAPVTLGGAMVPGAAKRTRFEIAVILLVAVAVVGGLEILLRLFQVPEYILPTPSAVAVALVKEFPLLLPHLGYTLVSLGLGFAIGASAGLVLAAVITQRPFVEKIVTPYILVLVTTRQRQDRPRSLVWRLDTPNLLEGAGAHGTALHPRRAYDRLYLRPADGGRGGNGGRRVRSRQPPHDVFLYD